jgi:hypothetical protein
MSLANNCTAVSRTCLPSTSTERERERERRLGSIRMDFDHPDVCPALVLADEECILTRSSSLYFYETHFYANK